MNVTTDSPIPIDHELYPALIQCFTIIGLGYVAGQLSLLTNTHAMGLSRYIGNFGLPAVIFKNLVVAQFSNISWAFMGSVLFAKTFVFLLTGILTALVERPRNYAMIGLYPIAISQTNDFALILPIINAVFSHSHPDFSRYIYLLAPINLAILNPLGFLLIELQKRIDLQKKSPGKTWNRSELIRKLLLDISRNPVIVSTILGIAFNFIFKQKLPNILEQILNPLSQSFTAVALFYLGLTMVGKLSRLNTHLVTTVCLLVTIKLLIFPLILRQTVFLLVSPVNETLDYTFDYSNLGFLYGTAPTAPSVVFYVPETEVFLQSVASTTLVVSTLLAGPIMLVSAKMINLKKLDFNVTADYESSLSRTGFDVSIISLLCTSVVLIGLLLRRRYLKISFIHINTFIFVTVQTLQGIWTIVTHFVTVAPWTKTAVALNLVSTFLALSTRTWSTSISIAMMITIFYSRKHARKYFWIYHLFGWFPPAFAATIIYLASDIKKTEVLPSLSQEKFSKAQTIVSICVLAICIIVTGVNILRITRYIFHLKHSATEARWVSLTRSENQPLVDDEDDHEQRPQVFLHSTYKDLKILKNDTQLFRHGILVSLLTINAVLCLGSLFWALLANNRDGIYYELQFIDTVLLHGQGILSFLVFALDADLLLPILRRLVRLLNCIGIRVKMPNRTARHEAPAVERSLDFQRTIRPDYIRYSISSQSVSNSTESVETTFSGSGFCQWLVSNGYMDNTTDAEAYCRTLLTNRHIVCVNREQNEESFNSSSTWYAFCK